MLQPVNGVIKLAYKPFVFRYIARVVVPFHVNFSFSNTFQNSAHEGLSPFLPCPNPFCGGDELPTDKQIVVVDDLKYNVMRYCRDDWPYYDNWIWNCCQVVGSGRWSSARVLEHDLRVFGRIVDGNVETIPISELKGISDKVYITAYRWDVDRLNNKIYRDMGEGKDLIKFLLIFE